MQRCDQELENTFILCIIIIAVYNLPKDFFKKKAQGAACKLPVFFPTNKYSECPMPCNEEEQQVHKFEKLEPTFVFS